MELCQARNITYRQGYNLRGTGASADAPDSGKRGYP